MGSSRRGPKKGSKKVSKPGPGEVSGSLRRRDALNTTCGKLTPTLVDAICGSIAKGNYAATACAGVGLNRRTYYRWLQLGHEKPDGPYGEFERRVRLAEAEREENLVEMIADAAKGKGDEPGDWRAAAWMLERMLPEKYGPHATIRHEGEIAHNMQSDVELALEGLEDDELDQLVELLGKAANGRRTASEGEAPPDSLRDVHGRGLPALMASSPDC